MSTVLKISDQNEEKEEAMQSNIDGKNRPFSDRRLATRRYNLAKLYSLHPLNLKWRGHKTDQRNITCSTNGMRVIVERHLAMV